MLMLFAMHLTFSISSFHCTLCTNTVQVDGFDSIGVTTLLAFGFVHCQKIPQYSIYFNLLNMWEKHHCLVSAKRIHVFIQGWENWSLAQKILSYCLNLIYVKGNGSNYCNRETKKEKGNLENDPKQVLVVDANPPSINLVLIIIVT